MSIARLPPIRSVKTKSDSLQLQDRDLALLRGLFECRVMTNDHATALYFDGKSEAEKKRLQKIKAAGLITERPPGLRERPSHRLNLICLPGVISSSGRAAAAAAVC
jgi:hypothetical protein